ncbi:30S ribosomal protein S6 [Chloroflexota bacterium]
MAAKKKEVIQVEDNRLNDYEMVFIVSPEINDESLENTVNGVSRFITDKNGTVSEIEHWGRKKLAYPIEHFTEGNYVLARFKINPARCRELEASLEISEEVLRHLLIRPGS